MRRLLVNLIGLFAAMTAAAVLLLVVTLPPAAVRPSLPPAPATLVSGAYHVHSSKSDGSGTVDDIAAAAGRAGLQFVILTDHGNAVGPFDPPAYRHGVLCIEAVEVSTVDGHVVALNLQRPSPFPLAGETRDVVEDIHRLGGWAVAAHPDSPRPSLRWRAGDVAFDGIEWLNADSEWRAHSAAMLATTAARSLLRAPESIASLFRAPSQTLRRWDAALESGAVFTLAALDAHARLGGDSDSGTRGGAFAVSFPGYATMFRTVAQTVSLPSPLSGDAGRDAAAVLAAIGEGHSYSVIRAFVDAPAALTFSAGSGPDRIDYGGTLVADGPTVVQASLPPGLGARLVLMRSGRMVASGRDELVRAVPEPGVYRVEAHLDGRALPWIVSNAIRIVAAPGPSGPAVADRPAPDTRQPPMPIPAETWTVEQDASSKSATTVTDNAIRLTYELGGGAASGQYVALATGAAGTRAIEHVEFTASSAVPVRLSVQVRLPGGANGQRWRRSIYVDETPRRFSVALADLEPFDPRSPLRPISARVQSVLLVFDTLNTLPGARGELTIRDAAVRPAAPVDESSGGR